MKNNSMNQTEATDSESQTGVPTDVQTTSKKATKRSMFRRLTMIVVIVDVVILGAGSAVAAISMGSQPAGATPQGPAQVIAVTSTTPASDAPAPTTTTPAALPTITIAQSSILYAGGQSAFAPGVSASVTFTATNPASTDQSLGTISLLSWSSNQAGCSSAAEAGWITMSPVAVNQDLAPGAHAVATSGVITFNDAPVNQDSCIGAALSFTYSNGGTGTATVGGPKPLVLHQASITYSGSGGLAPGTSATVTFSVDNPGTGNEFIGTISLLSWSSNVAGCSSAASPGLITMSPVAVNEDLAAGNGHQVAGTGTITFNGASATNVCTGASLTFTYVSN